MGRKYIDCRELGSDSQCTVAISADSDDELVEAAAHHAVQKHGRQDNPQLRGTLREFIRSGMPPE